MDKVSVFIIYDRAIDEEILDTLSGCCIEKYTRWHDASGVGESGPHLGDHIWPALNNVMMAVVEAEKHEIALYEKYRHYYSYGVYIAKKI